MLDISKSLDAPLCLGTSANAYMPYTRPPTLRLAYLTTPTLPLLPIICHRFPIYGPCLLPKNLATAWIFPPLSLPAIREISITCHNEHHWLLTLFISFISCSSRQGSFCLATHRFRSKNRKCFIFSIILCEMIHPCPPVSQVHSPIKRRKLALSLDPTTDQGTQPQ